MKRYSAATARVRASFPFRPYSRGFPVFSRKLAFLRLASLRFLLLPFFFLSSSLLFSLPPFILPSPQYSPYLKHTISIRSILFLHISLHLLFHQSEKFFEMHLRDFFVLSALTLAGCASARSIPKTDLLSSLPIVSTIQDDNHVGELVSRDANNRCGPQFGKCPDGKCCSTAGVSPNGLLSQKHANLMCLTDRLLRNKQLLLPFSGLPDQLWSLRCPCLP